MGRCAYVVEHSQKAETVKRFVELLPVWICSPVTDRSPNPPLKTRLAVIEGVEEVVRFVVWHVVHMHHRIPLLVFVILNHDGKFHCNIFVNIALKHRACRQIPMPNHEGQFVAENRFGFHLRIHFAGNPHS